MRCPECNSYQTKVAHTVPIKNGTVIRRYRKCFDCDARWTTFEITKARYEELYGNNDVR